LKGEPVMRAICHCNNCKQYNQGAYGDFLVYRETQIQSLQDTEVAYQAFQSPPLVQRGTCTQCGKPFAEKVRIPLFPRLFFVPVVNHPQRGTLPAPRLQIFSHRQTQPVGGDVPSYAGYVGSELPFLWAIARALWGHRV
jgi:hypothetical protein